MSSGHAVRDFVKRFILSICVLLVSVAVGYFLLVLAYSIPVEHMQENMRKSVEVFEKEGTYPKVMWNYNSRLDNYSDAFMLMMASYKTDESPWNAALHSYMYFGQYPDKVFVSIYGSGGEDYFIDSYSRFWHGYEIFIKPVLCFMNYKFIRVLMAVTQCLLIGILAYNLYKYDRRLIFPILGMWVFLNPVALAMSMQLNTIATVTIVMLIATVLMLRRKIRTGI